MMNYLYFFIKIGRILKNTRTIINHNNFITSKTYFIQRVLQALYSIFKNIFAFIITWNNKRNVIDHHGYYKRCKGFFYLEDSANTELHIQGIIKSSVWLADYTWEYYGIQSTEIISSHMAG